MKKYLVIAAFFGCTAIVLGAFGAHALKNILSESALTSFETGVKYQMYHALALLFVNSSTKISAKKIAQISAMFVLGVLLFSGSIYAISFGIEAKSIWFITPLGGTILIIGWVLMLFNFLKMK